ncbi:phosphosulfolactate synthase [Neobacillus notoginsengisoli]|uniref:Phosphosulfolactate synthase n=1 Tax=Neobacillus notoginsengisoli TaxID=1578198 RepID=A0A417YSJ7_9BACI|nr:phosphosulfolactate synthase [Neobacillus notoginsengisoli]RHW38959.1 phosphosulfolactate synthase [Neobacillus notoginsengisoli]
MNFTGLDLPEREGKPRSKGLTVLIDNGVPEGLFRDTINSAAAYIDFVKFGWGTSVVSTNLEKKIDILNENKIEYFFGGTLFEKFLSQNKADRYNDYCRRFGCRHVEISNGTLPIPNKEKATYIREFAKEFTVFSEVGHKDSTVSASSSEWLESIAEDLEAGAARVITEARESGTSGICRADGELRLDIVDEILSSGIPLERIVFEAPTKTMQTAFIKLAGPDANLANIPFSDAIALETLRLGLRSDTFFIFD